MPLNWTEFAEMRFQSHLRTFLGTACMGLPDFLIEEIINLPKEEREKRLNMLENGAAYLKRIREKRLDDLKTAKYDPNSPDFDPSTLKEGGQK